MGIGTLGERSLHAALKDWYARPGDEFEAVVDGYVIDIRRGDLLIEIQTRNIAKLKKKLTSLTRAHLVHLVHPVAAEKWIVRLGSDGATRLDRRRSPQHGRITHVFRELVSIPHLIPRGNLTLEVVLTVEEEIRANDGRGSWRRGGWSITDRHLLAVLDRREFRTVDDFSALLPRDLPDPFTVRDLAGALGERQTVAQKMAYCLRGMGAIRMVGKQRNAYLYSLQDGAS
jgi:hypothetical protein